MSKPPVKTPERTPEEQRLRARCIEAIERLPERQALAFSLKYEHEMTPAQIALTLAITVAEVDRLLLDAIDGVRRALGLINGEPHPFEEITRREG